jgi:FAD/FMN-containing dehydrogenase
MRNVLTRRRCLTGLAATALCTPTVIGVSPPRAAPLPDLPTLAPSEALLLRPGDDTFAAYQPAFNARVMVEPQLRALCRTTSAVKLMVDWCRTNAVPFALRAGGHCYEGLSQSPSVVIDTRLINQITVDVASATVTAGAGASLGEIYTALSKIAVPGKRGQQFALPAGSCPTVGAAGHVLGGGYGFLARPLGLACDSLDGVELIDAHAAVVEADAQRHSDLFWACRGGGGGSFGVATRFRFRLHPLGSLNVFGMSLRLSPAHAVKVMRDWQAWAPQAPRPVTALMRISRRADGNLDLRCFGQSTGSAAQLRRELKVLGASPQITTMSVFAAIRHFAGSDGWQYASVPMKGKSDYAAGPLGDDGIAALMNGIQRAKSPITVICDPYGGAIADTAPDVTAFAHRAARYCMQYVTTWSDGREAAHLDDVRGLYAAMRPFVSGGAYVNYCDLDLADWAQAYWGRNLARLRQIKSAVDPDNVFRHAQSIAPA